MTQGKETLREAVARAICEANLFDPDKLQENAEWEPQPMWMAYIPDADAAIATMFERLRTPSEAGIFDRIVTHEQALQSAKNFIDAHFNNADGKGVLTGIPARPDHDDLILTDYIRQQMARDKLLTAFKQENSDAD